jgi:putative oxidoreductase
MGAYGTESSLASASMTDRRRAERRAATAAANAPPRGVLMSVWAPQAALAALRVMSGIMLAQHGAQKMLGQLGGYGGTPGATAELMSRSGAAGMLELVGGLLLAIGLFTRSVAFILSGLMAFAYFLAHAPDGFWPILNRGELAALYCFVFLLIAAMGPGAASVDGLLRRRRHR